MSSRDPLWFCHECNAEMQPLMMPDPHCASCHGTFVEKMENAEDDPRAYQQQMPGGIEEGYPPGMDQFLLGLQSVLNHGPSRDRAASPPRSPLSGATRIELGGGPSGTTRILTFGGSNTLGRADSNTDGAAPTLAQFLRSGLASPDPIPPPGSERATDRAAITGPLMAQYLMALLGAQRAAGAGTRGGDTLGDPLTNIFGRLGMGLGREGGASGGGRWGDYVFNQEALDEIITQLMENSNSSRPVPATDEIITSLPRVTLSKGSSLLQRDCAVCKEQFAFDAEDPAERVVVTLPCTHPFHESCIVPWIKSSGTCPVCRYALVPQPDQHARDAPTGGGPRGAGSPPTSPRPPEPSQGPSSPPISPRAPEPPRSPPATRPRSPGSGGRGTESSSGGGGFFNTLFSGLSGGSRFHSRTSSTESASQARRRRATSEGAPNLPGGWDDVDA